MNYKQFALVSLAAPIALLAPKASAQLDDSSSTNLNHLSLSARIGFNVHARFKNLGTLRSLSNGSVTPDGNPYNYDNGYVLTDVSGSAGDQTWNWGYNSASQVSLSDNTVSMSRSLANANAVSPNGTDGDDPQPGWELNYDRELGTIGSWHYGVEGAVNYMRVGFSDDSSFSGTARQTTDVYPYTPGTTPPVAPYQGTFNGPGFLLGATPVSSTSSTVGTAIVGQRSFHSDIWGMRLGPYFERALTDRLDLSLSAGLAGGMLVNSASWNETVYIAGNPVATSSGSGHNTGFVWGGYVSADLSYQFSKRWSAEIGAQFQDLGKYQHDVGGRAVEVDLSRSLYVTVSAGYRF